MSYRVRLLGETSRGDFQPRNSQRMIVGQHAYHCNSRLFQGGVVSSALLRIIIPTYNAKRFHAPPYPVPATHPLSFNTATASRPGRPGILYSSIATSSSSAGFFSTYAVLIETCLKRRPTSEAVGIDSDELKELANDLWSMHDNFLDGGDGTQQGGDVDSLGEDEE